MQEIIFINLDCSTSLQSRDKYYNPFEIGFILITELIHTARRGS